jgi:uncharacterized protein
MILTTHQNADSFLQQTQAALEENEVANNLMLGLALRLKRTPDLYKTPPYFATVSDEAGLILAALMTPPYPLTLYRHRPDASAAYELVVRDTTANGWPVRAVSGRTPVPEEFAQVWSRITGAGHQVNEKMRAYELRQVIPPRPTPGCFRLATGADTELLARWLHDFVVEALPHDDPVRAAESAARRIHDGELFLWEDEGQPASMAAKARAMVTGIVVNMVYTPPELRGRGYASACVAALSQHLLDAGWQFCALFTDLANPTSNSIYQKIGYRPVCDFDEYGLIQTNRR